jgi:bilirubin oxidase
MAGALSIASRPAGAAELEMPPVFKNLSTAPNTVEVSLTASPARVSLLPGSTSEVFAYNGRVPGPTLEVREGDRVIVHFKNELPEPTSVHWHGIHLPVTADGSPLDPVPPGGSFDYVFPIPRGSAGTYWYHPHPHHRTKFQVAMGLFGALIVRADDDPLPASLPEKLLLLADARFDDRGMLDLGQHHSVIDEANGYEGNTLFVNGQRQPTISIRAGEVQRWRVINASAARFYRLSLPGHTFVQVGTDGGLFERPVERSEVLVTPSERVELLVRGTGEPGSRAVLQSLPYDRYAPQTRPADWNEPREILTLATTDAASVTAATIPATLRPVPPLDATKAATTRVVVLFQGFLNNRPFDEKRVDFTAALGATEIWQLENPLAMDHPFHLHGFQFQVLERNGVPEPFRAWKDTVNVPKGTLVRLVVRYEDYPGKWMFHCHILDHEDHGMMGILEVQ